jgi:hypothetical protein
MTGVAIEPLTKLSGMIIAARQMASRTGFLLADPAVRVG